MPTDTPVIVAGPWIGELGWELFCWQAWLREQAALHDLPMVVITRPGHEGLYHDFAHKIHIYKPLGNETDMWHNYSVKKGALPVVSLHLDHLYPQIVRHITYDLGLRRWWDSPPYPTQAFRQYTTNQPSHKCKLVLLIIRNTTKCNTSFRNWPLAHARDYAHKLQEYGYQVATIGTFDAAAGLDGVTDFRGMPLTDLIAVMASAHFIVGPQCGPIHLATLCGLPQITWQTCKEHAHRVKGPWNPFDTPVLTCAAPDRYWKQRVMWTPTRSVLVEMTKQMVLITKAQA
jgi:hypothetical protein